MNDMLLNNLDIMQCVFHIMKRFTMLDLQELQYLIAVEEEGSFSKASKRFFVSTPTITRAMKHVEKCFGATLFDREKNKVVLNETGKLAVQCARHVLHEAKNAMEQVKAFEISRQTIRVISCAPAPLWSLAPRISQRYPAFSVNTRIAELPEVESAFREENCDVAVLPYQLEGPGLIARHLMDENLFVCVMRNHPLAKHRSVTFEEINGFNFLLGTNLGIWNNLCREKLPASRFLVQDSEYSLAEIIKQSTLPCFTTDVAIAERYRNIGEDRVNVPISNPEASMSFYLVARDSPKATRQTPHQTLR